MALVNEGARVLENACVGPRLYLMRLSSPLIAGSIKPGQFVHMRIPGMEGHILRRPFSVYARDAEAGTVDILYQTVGEGSAHMAGLVPGQCGEAELIGPVGNAWSAPAGTDRALLVGGGVGAAPLYMLCGQLVGEGVRVDVVLGAQTKDALVCRDDYDAVLSAQPGEAGGPHPARCATDDGSFGRPGFCTSLSQEALDQAAAEGSPYDYVAVCGPEVLMGIVAHQALVADVPCQVSMERRMACGVGACLSCVVETTGGKKRSCVDGPIFDAREVLW